MKKLIFCLVAVLGLTTACAQKSYEVDEFTTKSGKTVKFHALMHACIRIEMDGKEIQIDPVAKLGDRTVDYAAMPKADYIFVTHEHGDHYDANAIKQLSGEKTQLVMNQRCADMYGEGMVMVRSALGTLRSAKNGDKLQLADISVEAVPAYNYTEGHTQLEMSKIKDIDIAFLPCNQPYTMTPDQLIRAAKVIKPKVLFPYHYGQTDLSGVPAQLKDIDVRIRHYE